ncbi:hypothetical protein Tco_0021349, partial [Tanacetum coccineum]
CQLHLQGHRRREDHLHVETSMTTTIATINVTDQRDSYDVSGRH